MNYSSITSYRYLIDYIGLVTWFSGNAFDSINEVTLRRAKLVLGWLTACGQVNHLGI